MIVVVMGIAGSGKSTVGEALAQRLHARFLDGDTLHSPENVARMRQGLPLDSARREPWHLALTAELNTAETRGVGLVLASSSLKRAYRDRFRKACPSVRFVFLDGALPLLQDRLEQRRGHFMPASLLQSQWETLEPPAPDEKVLRLDVRRPVVELVEQTVQWLSR